MPNDPRFFFDLGVGLPPPAAGGAALFFADPVTGFDGEPEKLFDAVEERLREGILDLDDLVRLFFFEVHLAHRLLGTEISAADRAGHFALLFPYRRAAAFADASVFPRAVTVTFLFHTQDYRYTLPICPV